MSVRNTQGPWKAVEYQAGDCWQIQYGDRGNWLAEVVIDGDEPSAEADARLIAAAPELLEAILAALPYVETAGYDDVYKVGHAAKVAARMATAIAKATGEAD